MDHFQQVSGMRLFLQLNQPIFNLNSISRLSQMDGFEQFEARRRKKFDKQIDSNVMMSSTALDEGIDLR
jgi:hypothetical protein